MVLYPINFSIPNEKIIKHKPIKTQILSQIIPGKTSYIFNKENEYYNEYQKSYFAITKKKAGWDCLRHYEIIANGCMPYFENIEKCPEKTMSLFNKELFIKANKLYNNHFKNNTINSIHNNIKTEYDNLMNEFLENLKTLSTQNICNYILTKLNKNVEKVLFLSGLQPGAIAPDYLRCLTLHGFKEKFGNNCVDYPKIPHLYKSNINKNLYGRGFTYSGLLDDSMYTNKSEKQLLEEIKNKYYDIIVYGSYTRGMPFYDYILKYYNPDDIILICGEDSKQTENNYKHYIDKGHTLFIREL